VKASSKSEVYGDRLALGAKVAERLASVQSVVAVLAVGSTVFGDSSDRSDLDLVVVVPDDDGEPGFDDWIERGVRVELERITLAEALETTCGGGWIWELRRAARLGANVPLHDPTCLGEVLRVRSAGMRPDRARYESQLDALAGTLAALSARTNDVSGKTEALRDVLDGLVVLALMERPRRYRKAKWTLADLAVAGETSLRAALIDAYGINPDPITTRGALALATRLVEGSLEALGAPSTTELQRHSPGHLEASYVARTLRDAHDLAQDGRHLDAQFTAKFAARLNVGLLAGAHGVSIDAERAQALAAIHAGLFADVAWSQAALSAAIGSARERGAFLTSLTHDAPARERAPA
jgi:hypothetical protein